MFGGGGYHGDRRERGAGSGVGGRRATGSCCCGGTMKEQGIESEGNRLGYSRGSARRRWGKKLWVVWLGAALSAYVGAYAVAFSMRVPAMNLRYFDYDVSSEEADHA